MNRARIGLAVLSLWVPALVIALSWMRWQERLPAELPTHWGASGPANAVTPAPVFFGWLLGVALAAAILGTILVVAPITGRWVRRAIGATAGAIAAFVASMWLASTVPSLDVTDPFTVELGAWVILIFIAPLYGLLQLVLLPPGKTPPVPIQHTIAIRPMPYHPSQTVAWSRTVSSRLFLVVAALLLALGVALFVLLIASQGLASAVWVVILYLAVVLLVAVFCAFRVTVDWRGFRITSALLGIPLKRIAAADIAAVDATVLEPLQWGGWGYRIMPGRSALILRKGPGLVITRRNGTQFAVTLDHPEEPASVLLGLIAADDTVHG